MSCPGISAFQPRLFWFSWIPVLFFQPDFFALPMFRLQTSTSYTRCCPHFAIPQRSSWAIVSFGNLLTRLFQYRFLRQNRPLLLGQTSKCDFVFFFVQTFILDQAWKMPNLWSNLEGLTFESTNFCYEDEAQVVRGPPRVLETTAVGALEECRSRGGGAWTGWDTLRDLMGISWVLMGMIPYHTHTHIYIYPDIQKV